MLQILSFFLCVIQIVMKKVTQQDCEDLLSEIQIIPFIESDKNYGFIPCGKIQFSKISKNSVSQENEKFFLSDF